MDPEHHRRLVTHEQMRAMVDYMQQPEHADLYKATKHRSSLETKHLIAKQWKELAKILNGVPGGAQKPPRAWNKYFNELKCKLKRKLIREKGDYTAFSKLEQAFLPIVGPVIAQTNTNKGSYAKHSLKKVKSESSSEDSDYWPEPSECNDGLSDGTKNENTEELEAGVNHVDLEQVIVDSADPSASLAIENMEEGPHFRRRRFVTYEQIRAMIDFMEQPEHAVLSKAQRPRSSEGKHVATKQWKELTKILNGVPGGVQKALPAWIKYFTEFKYRLRQMVIREKGDYTAFSKLEKRFLAIIGPVFTQTNTNKGSNAKRSSAKVNSESSGEDSNNCPGPSECSDGLPGASLAIKNTEEGPYFRRRHFVTYEQMRVMIDYMEQPEHADISKPPGQRSSLEARHTVAKQWKELAEILNGLPGGAQKTPRFWIKYFSELKCKLKKKLMRERNDYTAFSKLEKRFLAIIVPGSSQTKKGSYAKRSLAKVKSESSGEDSDYCREPSDYCPEPSECSNECSDGLSDGAKNGKNTNNLETEANHVDLEQVIVDSADPNIYPDWLIQLEKQRAAAEVCRATAEGERTKAALAQAEAMKRLAEAAVVQADAIRRLSEAATTQADALSRIAVSLETATQAEPALRTAHWNPTARFYTQM